MIFKSVNKEQPDHPEAVESQLQLSNQQLITLLRDGQETVTNVVSSLLNKDDNFSLSILHCYFLKVVADDRREIQRRIQEAQLRDNLLDVLQSESRVAMSKFMTICRHWEALEEVKDPVSMNYGLEQQKKRIGELMQQKDAIIAECRKELMAADENYYRDQEKQAEDLQCLQDRINNHVEKMKNAYRGQLELLQKTISEVRERMARDTDETWTELFDKKRDQEVMKLVDQKSQMRSDDKRLDDVVLSHEELIRSTKTRLESDNECLQLELQKSKADVLLNSQKLDYNFKVVQKRREEESVRNQQKKRLTKLNDTIVKLRRSLKEMDTKSGQELSKLRTEISKLKQQLLDLQQAASVTSKANDLKYRQCFDMNQTDCLQLVQDILDLNSGISSNELGLAANTTGGPKVMQMQQMTELKSYKAAIHCLNGQKEVRLSQNDLGNSFHDVSDNDLDQIFGHIIDNTGFIHEDKLLQVLEEVKESDSKLIRFTNLLKTFEINDQKEMLTMLSVFKRFIWCVKCASSNGQCAGQHEYTLEPDDILTALFELRHLLRKDENGPEIRNGTEPTISRLLDPTEVTSFWKQFEVIFPPDQEQLWTGLEYGLMQYLLVLRERETLFEDCESLRKQNSELARLLGSNN